jgi:hypothetical protein
MLWEVIVGAGVGVFSIYLAGFKIVAQVGRAGRPCRFWISASISSRPRGA